MDEIIKIKCPFDGAVLTIKYVPGIETKSVTCPICKKTYPYTEFKRVSPNVDQSNSATDWKANEEHTQYGGGGHNTYGGEGNTEIGNLPNYTLGKIKDINRGISYQLKPGRNVIGRKGAKSESNFQIDTGDKRSMSREHIVIEVKKVHGKGYVHYLSLYKEKVNSTFIGNEPLTYGDCIVLNHGDLIKLPDANLKFEIPDDEATDLN